MIEELEMRVVESLFVMQAAHLYAVLARPLGSMVLLVLPLCSTLAESSQNRLCLVQMVLSPPSVAPRDVVSLDFLS